MLAQPTQIPLSLCRRRCLPHRLIKQQRPNHPPVAHTLQYIINFGHDDSATTCHSWGAPSSSVPRRRGPGRGAGRLLCRAWNERCLGRSEACSQGGAPEGCRRGEAVDGGWGRHGCRACCSSKEGSCTCSLGGTAGRGSSPTSAQRPAHIRCCGCSCRGRSSSGGGGCSGRSSGGGRSRAASKRKQRQQHGLCA